MKKQISAFIALISVSLLCPAISQATPVPMKPAPHGSAAVSAPQKAALSWLALIDTAKYAESWDAASATFRAAVAKDQWVKQVQAAREPLGKKQSRTLKSGQRTNSLPGAPPGDYSLLIYSTTFEKQGAMQETVVLNHDKDGKWRVSGYFIKPAN